MLNKLFGQKQLLKEVSDRLDDCDEFLLLRAFKRMSNTEISALVSALPVHHSNQMLIILPNEVTRRIMAQGFVPRKLLGMIERELELERVKHAVQEKLDSTNRYIGPQSEPQEVAKVEFTDTEVPTSLRILDVVGRFVGNTFKK
jgi:hypothetical protein